MAIGSEVFLHKPSKDDLLSYVFQVFLSHKENSGYLCTAPTPDIISLPFVDSSD